MNASHPNNPFIDQPMIIQEKRFCFGKFDYRTASLIVAFMEIGYWFYYSILLMFAILEHKEAWSIVIMSVNLTLLTLQIALVFGGILKRRPKMLQSHLVYLCLTLIWDLLLTLSFFTMAVFPNALSGTFVNYKGKQWNARVFGIVMGCILTLWFVARFVTTVVIYRYWKMLRADEDPVRYGSYTKAVKMQPFFDVTPPGTPV
ncbi:unnamed protein product [Auanema sp. JU1783]|nr:unnamed protein product [Auanema sp. JU1783]